MKTINFTDFRKKASGFITEVEQGEQLMLLRRGKGYKQHTLDNSSIVLHLLHSYA